MNPVSDTANCLDIDALIEFFAYIFDVCIDRAIIEIIIISHDIFHERLSFNDSLRILDKIVEDRKFSFGHFDFFSGEESKIIFRIKYDIPECYHLFFFAIFFSFFCTFCYCCYTSHEFS